MSERLPDESFLVRPLTAEEAEPALRRSTQAFGGPAPHGTLERWRQRADDGELWAVEVDGEIMAHCRATAGEHWLGGQAVACQRIASVSVAPEHRGRGAAGALMRAMVRKGYSDGLGLSVLFPATTAMYRGLGWELAGMFQRVRLDTRPVPPIGPPLRLAEAPDWDALRACHDAFAASVNGAGRRPDDRWRELREAAEHVYVLDQGDGLEAYALVAHKSEPGDWQYILAVEDWAVLTPRGLEAVAGFVGRHGTLAKAAILPGPAQPLLGMHVPEQADWDAVTEFSWMARGLDVAAAIGMRGFPPGLAAEVAIEIDDPLLGEVRGPWRMVVEQGKGRVDPAGAADVTLSARAVGPLLTGFASAEALALGGLARGDRDALALLTAAFAAPTPYFLDFF